MKKNRLSILLFSAVIFAVIIYSAYGMVNQGKEAFKLSLDLYKQGLSPFQNVLDAQRSLLSYENALVQAQGYSLICLVQMYQALGGGW